MKIKNNLYNTNYLLLLLFIVISIIIYYLNIQTIKAFRQEVREQATFLVEKYSSIISSSDKLDLDSKSLDFMHEVMLPSLKVPIILENYEGEKLVINIDIPYDENTLEYKQYLKSENIINMQNQMDNHNNPLSIYYYTYDSDTSKIPSSSKKIYDLHYGDSKIIDKLVWLPYLEIIFFIFFILIAFSGFQLIRKDEKNLIYAGMARETAHQLGTPISSLMGWIKLLEEGDDKEKIIKYIGQDINRLSIISDRFSKIGSIPQMKKIDIDKLIKDVCDYIKTRAPKSIKFKIVNNIEEKYIKGDHILLDWAFQNIIKNSVDAISNNDNGEVLIIIDFYYDNYIAIDIHDNGKGIPRKHRNNIFRPGFSSKKRGWGLGLSLTKRIIEEIHFGKIWLIQSNSKKTIMRTILKL